MNEKVTVVIPVYNKEKYLCGSISSILSQTYENFELLLIDDGSTDNSPEICDEFTNKDARVRTIHKENGGVSSARNLGIESAEGSYITFLDADDELFPTALADMYFAAVENKADIAVGGIQNVSIDEKRNSKIITDSLHRDFILMKNKDRDAFCKIWEANDMLSSCTKLFSRDFLLKNDLRYDEKLVVLEDLDFVARCLLKVDVMVSVPVTVYRYFHYKNVGANYLRRSRRDFADDVAAAYNRQKQVFEHFGVDFYENRWQRWRCVFGNFGGALDSIWSAETEGFRGKIDKCKRIREVLKKPEFCDYVVFEKDNLRKNEYFYMKHPSLLNVFLLRRVRKKLGK